MTTIFARAGAAASQFFSDLWAKISPTVKTDEQVAQAFFKAAETDAAAQLKTAGLQIVTDAVSSAEATGGTAVEKLAAATAKVLADLGEDAKTIPAHVINAAIEAAVSQLNASEAATAAVDTTVAAQAAA